MDRMPALVASEVVEAVEVAMVALAGWVAIAVSAVSLVSADVEAKGATVDGATRDPALLPPGGLAGETEISPRPLGVDVVHQRWIEFKPYIHSFPDSF